MVKQVAACHLGAQPDGPGVQHAGVPYVLIQGPPGTGKTHTVKVLSDVQQGALGQAVRWVFATSLLFLYKSRHKASWLAEAR